MKKNALLQICSGQKNKIVLMHMIFLPGCEDRMSGGHCVVLHWGKTWAFKKVVKRKAGSFKRLTTEDSSGGPPMGLLAYFQEVIGCDLMADDWTPIFYVHVFFWHMLLSCFFTIPLSGRVEWRYNWEEMGKKKKSCFLPQSSYSHWAKKNTNQK